MNTRYFHAKSGQCFPLLVAMCVCVSLVSAGDEGEVGAATQVVSISGVSTEQYGALLKVKYDLSTSDGQPSFVSGSYYDHGGTSFRHGMRSVAGDANKAVLPGSGRWFVWNFHADGIAGLNEDAVVRVQQGYYPGCERVYGNVTFCWIPPGTFMMGRYPGEQDSYDTLEDPQHEVTLTHGFWLGKYEVTQAQWKSVMDYDLSTFKGDNRPVEGTAWMNNICYPGEYLDLLNAAYPGNEFRLPTEAEWEYAYRAGTTTRFYWGDDPDYSMIDDYAWHLGNSRDETHEVGKKLPNAWGLYDMAGNVFEWCQDTPGYYPEGPVTDPVNLNPNSFRVTRGGAYYQDKAYCRAASRPYDLYYAQTPWLGFRLARSADVDEGLTPNFSLSDPFTLDASPEALAPCVDETPYTAVSALEDGVAEATRDLDGDGYPDAFADGNGNGVPDAFEEHDGEGRYVSFLDSNDNTFPDWVESRYPKPVAKFVITDFDQESRTLTLRNVSVAGVPGVPAVTGYHWDFGDGATFDGFAPPAHTYAALDNYLVTLAVAWTGGVWLRKAALGS